jgi:hypothetical protein
MRGRPQIPESTKVSLQQRLREHARTNWSYLASKDGYEDSVLPTGGFAGAPPGRLGLRLRPLPLRRWQLTGTTALHHHKPLPHRPPTDFRRHH